MKETYEGLVDHAETLVEKAHQDFAAGYENAYVALLTGYGNWRVSINDSEHNWQAVTDAVHKRYKADTAAEYNKEFQKGLMILAGAFASITGLELLLKYFFYQLELEKKEKAVFTIDKEALSSKIRINMEKEQENLKRDTRYWWWISKAQQYAMDHYGVEI